MGKWGSSVLFSLLFFLSANASDFDCAPVKSVVWEEVAPGLHLAQYDVRFTPYSKDDHEWMKGLTRSVTVRALKVDLSLNRFLIHRPDSNLSCDTKKNERYVRKMIEDTHAPVMAAINASFFVMPDQDILGLALDENRLWRSDLNELTISSAGVFGIGAGLPFLRTRDEFISQHGATPSKEDLKDYSFVIEAYPRLVQNQAIQVSDAVKNVRCARTSIGVDGHTGEIMLTTIDAAGYNSQTGMTLYEYAHLLKTEKCGVAQSMALNLDGGGSTAFSIPSKGMFHQVDRCRHLGNILTVQKR